MCEGQSTLSMKRSSFNYVHRDEEMTELMLRLEHAGEKPSSISKSEQDFRNRKDHPIF